MLRDAAAALIYDSQDQSGSHVGWGSIEDPTYALGASPFGFDVTSASDQIAGLRTPGATALRHYWWQLDNRAARQHGLAADPALIHRLNAADVILFPAENGVSAVVTVRDDHQFGILRSALRDLAVECDEHATVVTDAIPEAITEDLFLWLLYRLQWQQQLSANLYLAGIQEINSLDRSLRGARFQDEATVDRVELAALVAIGTKAFGPAKITALATNPDAEFQFELYPDGGFQPYRRSNYENRDFSGGQQALILTEDLWTIVLPELREAHSNDEEWQNGGRSALRLAARNNVLSLLGDEPPRD
ncbi:hypothetical protein [Microbacterium sp. MYb72]|uniref:hypothetical protein n=1 Tax=Microbacterium sp. MYb72 TaxID=1848693 RepID=UPI0011B00B2E|nr:hypothetical protein [Microbacterium sp. MYb72]